jgi:Predicted transcriptional regulators
VPDTSGQPGGEVGAAGLDYIAEPLRPLAVPIGELNADPANARRHPDRNMAAIEASLRRWGQRFPIVVQRQGMVVRAGNGRLEAARRLGWTHLAAVVVDEDSVEATAFALADNRSAELAEWDDEALAALLQSLPTDVPTGFSEGDLEALLAELNPVASGDTSEQLDGLVYKVLVECDGEQAQVGLLERLEAEGYKCRALML